MIAVILDVGSTMALGELLTIGAQDHRKMRKGWNIKAERLIDQDLSGCVRKVIVTSYHMGDAHVRIIADNCEVIRGTSVASHQNHVIHHISRKAHRSIHRIIKLDRRMILRHRKTPHVTLTRGNAARSLFATQRPTGTVVARIPALFFLSACALLIEGLLCAKTRISRSAFFEPLKSRRISGTALGLKIWPACAAHLRTFVPIEAKPAHRTQDDLRVLLGRTLRIGVLDPQDEISAASARESPVINSGSRTSDVKHSCGRRRESHPYFFVSGHLLPFPVFYRHLGFARDVSHLCIGILISIFSALIIDVSEEVGYQRDTFKLLRCLFARRIG